MSPELAEHLAHIGRGDYRPDDCEHCRRTWHYRSPAQRVAYATRRLVFGRGLPDDV